MWNKAFLYYPYVLKIYVNVNDTIKLREDLNFSIAQQQWNFDEYF